MKVPGYHGRYRRIDVGLGQSTDMGLDENVLRRFIGGSGLGAYLLLREKADAVDPLSPGAPLAFVFSPLVGSPLTTSAKFAVVCRSPLTQRINDSLASSAFAIAGKRCGADAIVIVGRAAEPSVLVIDDDDVRVEPAEELWGLSCDEAATLLRKRLGADFQIAAIGPAGERLVRYATISHDGRHAGRGGSGAVLGAKNIKAIAVRGTRRTTWAHASGLVDLARDISARSFGPATAKYRELGTAANLLVFNRLGVLPTRNFQQGSFAAVAELSPEQMSVAREKTRASCAACTIGCEHIYSVNQASGGRKPPVSSSVRVEYENLFALGPLCGISDPDAVLTASQQCDALGLDTISAGGTIAFAMECVERGLLDAPWLKFGDATALHRAIDEIGQRRGLGGRLAEGSRRLALEIGGNAIDFAPQVKGLEMPGYEPRALQTMALGFAVGSRGADHNRSGAYEVDFSASVDRRAVQPEDAWRAAETEDKAALMDSLILCKFLRGVFEDFVAEAAEMLRLVTGWDVTPEELQTTAARIVAAKKLLNIRSGWQPNEDTLPARFLEQALPGDDRAVLSRERLGLLVSAYNTSRGYTLEGWLPEDVVESLGLGDV
ncbi:MAG: aldehyde ferredoxin oxidoreductase family protein [Planctomycetes bacterium]|nr:aldehyde ferredoxin oxidoreductase family protein [Planctomycetota bacterium]